MYRKTEDFLADWKSEEESTLKIFSGIPDSVLSVKENENIRSLGRLAWHITQTLTEMPYRAGIVEEDVLDNLPVPGSMKEIVDLYKLHSADLIEKISKKWTDDMLTEEIEVYNVHWERRKVLSVLVAHQIHHRAQMTVLMRLLSLPVPGIYGPSKEEWSAYGMPAME